MCEFSHITDGKESPLTTDEYKELVEKLNMRSAVFCVLQDRLFGSLGSLLHKDNLKNNQNYLK